MDAVQHRLPSFAAAPLLVDPVSLEGSEIHALLGFRRQETTSK